MEWAPPIGPPREEFLKQRPGEFFKDRPLEETLERRITKKRSDASMYLVSSASSCMEAFEIEDDLITGIVGPKGKKWSLLAKPDYRRGDSSSRSSTASNISRSSIASSHLTNTSVAFRRRGNSLAMALGFNWSGDWNDDVANIYTKFSNKQAVLIFCCTTLDPGCFILACNGNKFGWITSLLMIFTVASAYVFVLRCFIEVPTLTDTCIETCSDMISTLLSSFWQYPVMVLLMARCLLFGAFMYDEVIKWGEPLFSESQGGIAYQVVACILLTYSAAFWSSPRSVRLNAKLGYNAMVMALGMLAASSVMTMMMEPAAEDRERDFNLHSMTIWALLRNLMNRFSQSLCFVPHIVGDMDTPQHAKKAITKGVLIAVFFQMMVFVVGKIGGFLRWEGTCRNGFLDRIELAGQDSWILLTLSTAIRLMLVVRSVTTFNFCIWPLSREAHHIMAMDTTPAVSLRLPWAVKRNQRAKLLLRIILVISSSAVIRSFWMKFKNIDKMRARLVKDALPACLEFLALPVCIAIAFGHAYQQAVEYERKRQAQELKLKAAGLLCVCGFGFFGFGLGWMEYFYH